MVGNMQFVTTTDHIAASNPYERFMISILDRLSKIEERVDRLGKGLEAVGSGIDTSAQVVYIKTSPIDPSTYKPAREVIGADCIVGRDNIQVAARDQGFFSNIEQTIRKLKLLGLHTESISVRPSLEINEGMVFVTQSITYNLKPM